MEHLIRYYPILKGKEGEYKALKESSVALKQHLTPIIELLGYYPRPLTPQQMAKRKKPLRTFDDHLADNIKSIIGCWKEVEDRIFIDIHRVPEENLMRTGNIGRIFDGLYDADIIAVPVVSTQLKRGISSSIKAVVSAYECGLCLRLAPEDMDDEEVLAERIDRVLEYYGVDAADVDLIMDFGSVDANSVTNLSRIVSMTINAMPFINEWRTFILAAAAFPIDLSDQPPNTVKRISRADWTLWQAITKRKLTRMPNYGDYAIAHPDIRDIGDVIPNMSVSFRYTSHTEWVILKARGVKNNGFDQSHQLASDLVVLSDYDGEHFSQGDFWINECSARRVSSGNATTWRQAGSNHHFHKVIDQLSSLYGS